VHTAALDYNTASTSEDNYASFSSSQVNSNTILSLPVSFPIFVMGFMAFIGWFLFVCFGGVGLSALPIDMILDFMQRPKLMTSKDAAEKRSMLKKKTTELLELGSRIKDEEAEVKFVQGFWAKRKQKSKASGEYKKFKTAVLCLDTVTYPP
jgi:LMBR1 domain-containing protein 1